MYNCHKLLEGGSGQNDFLFENQKNNCYFWVVNGNEGDWITVKITRTWARVSLVIDMPPGSHNALSALLIKITVLCFLLLCS